MAERYGRWLAILGVCAACLCAQRATGDPLGEGEQEHAITLEELDRQIPTTREIRDRILALQDECCPWTPEGERRKRHLEATVALIKFLAADEFVKLDAEDQRLLMSPEMIDHGLHDGHSDKEWHPLSKEVARRVLERYREAAAMLGPTPGPVGSIQYDLRLGNHDPRETANAYHSVMSHAMQLGLAMARWEQARIRTAMAEGNHEEVLESASMLLNASSVLKSVPFITGRSLGHSAVQRLCGSIRVGLAEGEIDTRLAEELLLLLNSYDLDDARYSCVLHHQRHLGLLTIRMAIDDLGDAPDDEKTRAELVRLHAQMMMTREMVDSYCETDDGSIDLPRLMERFERGRVEVGKHPSNKEFGFFSDPGGMRMLLHDAVSGRADVLVTKTMLALELYRSAEGEYPESLDELVPRYLHETPIDPFGGEGSVMGYRVLYEGHTYPIDMGYALWTIGPDGIDQGLPGVIVEPSGLEVIDQWLLRGTSPGGTFLLNGREQQDES